MEASDLPGMTCRPGWMNAHQQGVKIAIKADVDYILSITRNGTLMPEFLPAARPEMGLAGFDGALK